MRDIKPSSSDETLSERSIRNIHLGHHRHHQAAPVSDEEDELPQLPRRKPRKARRHLWLIGGAVVLACATFTVLISTVFAGASITVYPRVETVSLPASIQAQLNAPVGVLSYQNLSITKSASQTAPAQGTQHVSRAASGVITISNTYSAASQRLIANTRFVAPDGKIYRIRDSVTVPGMAAGKAGTATATIYADSAGPDYNKSGSITFTIPGFKGDPRYTKFSATNQGAISGGFIGEEAAVAPADLAATKSALQKQLDAEVRSAAANQIPEGFVAIPATLEVSFSGITQTNGTDKTATLTQSATAIGAMVRQSDLATAIARKAVQGYGGEPVLFGDVSKMEASAATSTKRADGVITINLSGMTELIWQFDAPSIKVALLGKDKSEFETTIKSFEPAVAKATASIRPFWQGTFPSDPDKFSITVLLSK